MGLVPGRIDEALLAVNKPPYCPSGPAAFLLSKSSQLKSIFSSFMDPYCSYLLSVSQ
jgi:hypothetical protein